MSMKAMVYAKYGPPDVLQLKEIEKPSPKENEVLIKVCAVSLNASDWELLRGKPLYTRMMGFLKPRYKILGSDVAGVVEAVGVNVKRFQPGDAVFGDIFECMGAFAEYVCAPENALTPKPERLSFEQAAAIPQGACIALQGLCDKGQIQPGQKVLINGAGGSAGLFAVQMAKLFGAELTGVDNTRKLAMMRTMGADHVIDYTQEDFTQANKVYDLVLDLAAYHSIFKYTRVLKPGGIFLMVGGSVALIFQLLILGPLISMLRNKKLKILQLQTNKDLEYILELIATGKIVPVVDRCFALNEVPEALRYLGEGQSKGKVVISLLQNTKSSALS